MKRLIALLPTLLLLAACDQDFTQTWDYKVIHSKVTQVRILQAGDTIVKDDNHAVAGAIVGHALIGGTKGAIIGAAMGSGDVTKTHVEEVKACELYVTDSSNVTHKFLLTYPGELLNHCALTQPGDDVDIQYHWLHSAKTPDKAVDSLWTWQCASNETNPCEKEEQP